jgi:hypothetical protein
MKGIDFFIEFCSSSKPIGKIICRYDAQKYFEQFKHQELSFCNMKVFPLLNATLIKISNKSIRWFSGKKNGTLPCCTNKKCVPLMCMNKIGFENLSSFVQTYKNKFGTLPTMITNQY